ncbi:MAG: hypothetical protein QG594_2100, partial [Bacteroidota bacterium]|nr:hypothetical protein [Bacteroidota bacterium]
IWILILSGVLLLAYGLFLIKNNNPRIGFCITSLGIFLTVYLNLLMLPVVILILLAAFKKKIFSRSYSRSLQIFFVLILPLLIISLMHPVNVSLVMKREISLFREVKLVNSINVFRGESEKLGFPILGKLIENKFTYFGRHVLFNFLTALSPYTYFTQQFPLLGFSFSPPVFLGFLIPSLYYLIAVVKKHKPIFDLLLIAFPLLIPTLLHSYFPDMNSLVIFLPLLLVFISRGIDLLVNDKKNLLIFIMLILVFFQASTTLYDLSTREPARYFLKTGITNEKK